MVTAEQLITSLNQKIETALAPRIPYGQAVALLDFPSHTNVGDSAIWLAETAFLRRNRNRIVYICDPWSYSRSEAEKRIGDAMILISGGGNFGDLYPANQLLRERVIADFPHRRIVQLPQTISFTGKAAAERARAALNAHSNLTLMVRDRRSLAFAEQQLEVPAVLCPDLAFALGGLRRPRPPVKQVLWLARSDTESAVPAISAASQVEVADWLGENQFGGREFPSADVVLRRARVRLAAIARRRGKLRSILPESWGLYDVHARGRLAYGCEVLARGRTVVTDRLHGHILSILLGIPHVLIDNNYGKIESFHATWTRDLNLVRWAESPRAALVTAEELADANEA